LNDKCVHERNAETKALCLKRYECPLDGHSLRDEIYMLGKRKCKADSNTKCANNTDEEL